MNIETVVKEIDELRRGVRGGSNVYMKLTVIKDQLINTSDIGEVVSQLKGLANRLSKSKSGNADMAQRFTDKANEINEKMQSVDKSPDVGQS